MICRVLTTACASNVSIVRRAAAPRPAVLAPRPRGVRRRAALQERDLFVPCPNSSLCVSRGHLFFLGLFVPYRPADTHLRLRPCLGPHPSHFCPYPWSCLRLSLSFHSSHRDVECAGEGGVVQILTRTERGVENFSNELKPGVAMGNRCPWSGAVAPRRRCEPAEA